MESGVNFLQPSAFIALAPLYAEPGCGERGHVCFDAPFASNMLVVDTNVRPSRPMN